MYFLHNTLQEIFCNKAPVAQGGSEGLSLSRLCMAPIIVQHYTLLITKHFHSGIPVLPKSIILENEKYQIENTTSFEQGQENERVRLLERLMLLPKHTQ
jgi:hypothetical protein